MVACVRIERALYPKVPFDRDDNSLSSGGGTLLPKCGPSLAQSGDGNSKVNGWGPFFANDR